MPSNHLILCPPLLCPPSVFPSIRVFFNESVLCIKYWSFSFRISPDWLDLLAVQGTLKSLLQHHSSKASILQCSAFFIAQLSHPYMTTGKTIALTRWTFVDKVVSLLFNMLSRLVMYGCESWTIKKAERRRIDAFELWCWRRLESPLDCREIKPVLNIHWKD